MRSTFKKLKYSITAPNDWLKQLEISLTKLSNKIL